MRRSLIEVDKAIFEELHKSEPLGCLELKSKVEKNLRRERQLNYKLSLHTYSSHINNLLRSGLLRKENEGARGRGKKVLYYLTEEAQRVRRLEITPTINSQREEMKLGFKEEEDPTTRRQIVYKLLFFFGIIRTRSILYSEQELDRLLSTIGKTREDLVVTGVVDEYRYFTDGKLYHLTFYKSICGISICKEEKDGQRDHVIYNYWIAGVSVSDLLKPGITIFDHIELKESEVKDAVALLSKEGIIAPIMEVDGIKKYGIVDQRLDSMIYNCCGSYMWLFLLLLLKWRFIANPKPEERKWLAILIGYKGANYVLRGVYDDRQVFRRHSQELTRAKQNEQKKQLKMMKKYVNDVVAKVFNNGYSELQEKYSDTIKQYSYISKILIEIGFPVFLRQS